MYIESGSSWRAVFKDGIEEASEAALVLRGNRLKAKMTQKELAEKIEVRPRHISEMEHGKRSIGKDVAHRLGKVFSVDYRVFL